MTISVGMITFDTLDPLPLARWWADQTGGTIVEENEGWFVTVATGEGKPMLAFQKVDDPTPGKNRVHLDLITEDREAEVQRLLAGGATLVARREMPGLEWVTLADPDGNQFCVAAH
ncbi:MAG: VOC family protein [Gordonia sp. (in: high G+C Gram-positive bacteria)]|uniref:VOC family protein n=1 Tax=Gordonia sp. (in: high G+C Gram-positive bacteria) TaxID=84139 RepID=UPI0039E6EE8C